MSTARRVRDRLTLTVPLEAFQLHVEDYGGYCLHCGAEAFGCEPDARNYRCDLCGRDEVFGAEEALIMGRVELEED